MVQRVLQRCVISVFVRARMCMGVIRPIVGYIGKGDLFLFFLLIHWWQVNSQKQAEPHLLLCVYKSIVVVEIVVVCLPWFRKIGQPGSWSFLIAMVIYDLILSLSRWTDAGELFSSRRTKGITERWQVGSSRGCNETFRDVNHRCLYCVCESNILGVTVRPAVVLREVHFALLSVIGALASSVGIDIGKPNGAIWMWYALEVYNGINRKCIWNTFR